MELKLNTLSLTGEREGPYLVATDSAGVRFAIHQSVLTAGAEAGRMLAKMALHDIPDYHSEFIANQTHFAGSDPSYDVPAIMMTRMLFPEVCGRLGDPNAERLFARIVAEEALKEYNKLQN